MFEVKLNTPAAQLPRRATPGSAGLDLYSAEELTIPAGERRLVDLGFSMAFSKLCYARIAPRSSLAVKGIDVGAGVIDADYRGPVKVLLINNSKQDFPVRVRDRVAQMIFEKIRMLEPMQVDDLDSTSRGAGGFGSTGL
jgi:deoxyuridine 5'-triphosphate nucleotidohydrolase